MDWAKARNLLGFGATIGLIPVSYQWGLELYAPDRWSLPIPDQTAIYWLLTGLPGWAWITWVVGFLATGLAVMWVGKHLFSGLKIRPPGILVAIAIQLAVFTFVFFVPIIQAGNVHVAAAKLNGRVFYMSEWRNMRSAGYFSLWACDQAGIVCRVIKAITLEDYGLSRLRETQASLLVLPDKQDIEVVIDGQSILAYVP